ncbi:MAG TPA: porin [Steroidobacteraceae bacterium]|jgi:predicted porin
MLNLRLARPIQIALAACAANIILQGSALADDAQENKQLKEEMRQMMQRMDALQKQVEALSHQQQAAPPPAAVAPPPPPPVPQAVAKNTKETSSEPMFDKFIKGFYGTLDASVDGSTKGMDGMVAYHYGDAVNGVYPQTGVKGTPYGPVGWQPSIATNTATLGWRGSHAIPGLEDTRFVIQIEANVGLTDSPGVTTSYTAQTAGVRGGIGSGTTYVGFVSPTWGALKLGHGSTPYGNSQRRLDPFAGMVGDMYSIMSNTGGDNRVEFNTAMDHSIWYESPKLGPVSFDLFFSPGQNRTADADLNLAGGSSNCSGGNVPGSGNLLLTCDDGGFDNAYSMDLKFETEHLYLMAAYELHKHVNRNSDGIGSNSPGYAAMLNEGDPAAGGGGALTQYLNWGLFDQVATAYGATGSCTTAPSASTYYCVNATPEFTGDIGDEAAFHVGGQYVFDFGLTVDAIFERMTRKLPAALEFQNERQRNGAWLALTQTLGPKDNLNLGWAHAGRTPGDPGGQHNYNPNNTDNTANMFSLAYKHHFDKQLYWYADLAETINSGNAHYDLGAGSHGIKTDCHDGTTTPIIDYTSAGNTTWGGCRPKAVSMGVNYKF